MKGGCLISGEVSGSLIKRFQELDDVLKKFAIYVVEITEFISAKQDVMPLPRPRSIIYKLEHCKSGFPLCLHSLLQ